MEGNGELKIRHDPGEEDLEEAEVEVQIGKEDGDLALSNDLNMTETEPINDEVEQKVKEGQNEVKGEQYEVEVGQDEVEERQGEVEEGQGKREQDEIEVEQDEVEEEQALSEIDVIDLPLPDQKTSEMAPPKPPDIPPLEDIVQDENGLANDVDGSLLGLEEEDKDQAGEEETESLDEE